MAKELIDLEKRFEKSPGTIDDLKFHVHALNELLKDPQWGLAGWCMLYSEHMKFISDYWKNN